MKNKLIYISYLFLYTHQFKLCVNFNFKLIYNQTYIFIENVDCCSVSKANR